MLRLNEAQYSALVGGKALGQARPRSSKRPYKTRDWEAFALARINEAQRRLTHSRQAGVVISTEVLLPCP